MDHVYFYGFVIALLKTTEDEMARGCQCLLSIMHVPIGTIYYIDNTSFVSKIMEYLNVINFISQAHTPLMKMESSLSKRQLHKWIKAYNNN